MPPQIKHKTASTPQIAKILAAKELCEPEPGEEVVIRITSSEIYDDEKIDYFQPLIQINIHSIIQHNHIHSTPKNGWEIRQR